MGLSKNITLTIKDYEIKLDKQIKFYENDTINLCFSILEYGIEVKNGVSVNKLMPIQALRSYMLIETPQGIDYAESTIIENNKIVFNLGSKYSRFVGIGHMQIVIKDSDGCRVTLPEFEFEIKKSINTDWDREAYLLTTEDDSIIIDQFGREIHMTKISDIPESENLSEESYTIIVDGEGNKRLKVRTIADAVENSLDAKFNVHVDEINGGVERIKGEINEISESLDEIANKVKDNEEIDDIKKSLDEIANKGTTIEVLERVTKEEIDRQIQDGTIANLTIEDGSITKEKLSKELNDFIENQLNSNYNTILQLPYASRESIDIMLHLEKQDNNESIKYINYVTNNNFTDGTNGFTQGIGSLDVFEATVFDNRNCIKLSKNGKNYGQIKYIRDGFTYEKDKYYYFSYDYYIESAEPQYSKENIVFLGLHQYDNTQIGRWIKKSIIATPPSTYLNAPHSTFQFSIEVGCDSVTEAENLTTTIYMTNFKLVNLTDNGLYNGEEITDNFIKLIDEKISKADVGENSIYGCNVKINDVIVETPTFRNNETIDIFKSLSQGDVVSISEIDGYILPKATLKSKSVGENNGGDSDYLQSEIIKTRFYGKRFYFDGDSITDFDYNPTYNNKSWANYCAETLGASSVTNVAVGGIKIGEVLTRTKATDFSNYDVVFIAVGTNNIPANTTLGEYNSTDETTMAGALNSIIRHIQISNPYTSIFVLSPIHRYPGDLYYEKLVDIKNIYEEVCQYNSVNCINMLKCGINAKDQTLYSEFLIDGLHPTIEGHKKMAQYVVGQVSSL